ncbi:MAG: hypothetical protein JRJ03_19325 [Deltaproteobacteria bacterium]|nr:hypothetical protein [Deltaproteobacteria bacterium]
MDKSEQEEQDRRKKPLHAFGVVDRRSMVERRRFSYHAHIPERRTGRDRRRGVVEEMEASVPDRI